jgi:hypothetical protein
MSDVKVSVKKIKNAAIVRYYIRVSDANILWAIDNGIKEKLEKLTTKAIKDYYSEIIDERIINLLKEKKWTLKQQKH